MGERSEALIKIQKELKTSEKSSVVQDLEMNEDSNFAMKLVAGKRQSQATLLIPEPGGDFSALVDDDFVDLGPGTIISAMNALIQDFATKHKISAPVIGAEAAVLKASTGEQLRSSRNFLKDSTASVESAGDYFGDEEEEDDFAEFEEEMRAVEAGKEKMNVLANAVWKLHGKAACGIYNESTGNIWLRLRLPVGFLEKQMASAWRIDLARPIIVELEFFAPSYLDAAKPPVVSLYQSSDASLDRKTLADVATFGLSWQMHKRVEEWLKVPGRWPPRDGSFLVDLMNWTMERVLTCNKFCIICDTPLPFEMLKPAVCESPLCLHSHEQYGLGEDVASTIRANSDVVDFLISTAVSGCQGDARRFNPFPMGLEVKVSRSDMTTETRSFLTANKDKDMTQLRTVLNILPPVKELSEYPDTVSLKKSLDTINPLMFPLLRWILTSNRAHLIKMDPKDHLSEMKTPHQYVLLSSSPEKEQQFSELKKNHPSFWAFHGSGFGNWHSILRIGLKNYSNTPLMSTGAVYGPGIYLAPDSGTSLSYSRTMGTWAKSIFSQGNTQAQCLALCEVINFENKYVAKPYYVIPDETHVITRFFFIYAGGATCGSVKAAGLKPPPLSSLTL